MEYTFTELKQKEVISVADGKHLGKVCDIALELPEGRVRGLFVTGGKGFRFGRQDVFIPLSSVVRIGEDVIITNNCPPCREGAKPGHCKGEPVNDCRHDRRSYDEYE